MRPESADHCELPLQHRDAAWACIPHPSYLVMIAALVSHSHKDCATESHDHLWACDQTFLGTIQSEWLAPTGISTTNFWFDFGI